MRANNPPGRRIRQHAVHPAVQARLLQLAVERERRDRTASRERETNQAVQGTPQAGSLAESFNPAALYRTNRVNDAAPSTRAITLRPPSAHR